MESPTHKPTKVKQIGTKKEKKKKKSSILTFIDALKT